MYMFYFPDNSSNLLAQARTPDMTVTWLLMAIQPFCGLSIRSPPVIWHECSCDRVVASGSVVSDYRVRLSPVIILRFCQQFIFAITCINIRRVADMQYTDVWSLSVQALYSLLSWQLCRLYGHKVSVLDFALFSVRPSAHGATRKKLIGHANYQPFSSELLPF